MKLARVKGSSNIERVGYDDASRKLTVQFKGGGRWSYAKVPRETYLGLRNADSKGQFFHENVRDVFEATRHEEER